MKGIILAGGNGTRLYPSTIVINKQLIPVYDKPMIYYPICTLMFFGIREILIIITPKDKKNFKKLLGDGSKIGCNFSYKVQKKPNGIAQAFIIGKKFIGKDSVALILGDNIFFNLNMKKIFQKKNNFKGGIIFSYKVKDPSQYGIINFDNLGKPISIEEKPKNPKSNYAIPGLYFYDNSVIKIVKNIQPSIRNELEITEINNFYLKKKQLKIIYMDKKVSWFDVGTFDTLLLASQFIKKLKKKNFKIGSIKEVAYQMGFI